MLRSTRLILARPQTITQSIACRHYAKKADLTKNPKTGKGPSKEVKSAGSSHGADADAAGKPQSGGETPGLEEKGGHAIPSGQFAEQHEAALKVGGVTNSVCFHASIASTEKS